MIKVLPLCGLDSLRAYNAFHVLMLGLKMLPSYMSEKYETFFDRVQEMPEDSQRKMIREAAQFVELNKDDLAALLSFACDPNGVAYDKTNSGNLNPADIIEIIVEVCMGFARIKPTQMITDAEKKNSQTAPLT